jgi:2-polyprenyl-3-methyl-5-hydroxy-6-metoxy-1,4-benzoquinol methylase
MSPFLNDEGLGKYYANYIGRRRLNNDLKMEQRKIQYQSDREFIEHFINDGKILDVGCNGGFFLEALSTKFEKHGIEIDPEAVAYAKKLKKHLEKTFSVLLWKGLHMRTLPLT